MNRKLILVFMASILVLLSACTSLNKITPKVMDDEAIELEVRKNLGEDLELKSLGLGVDVNGGVVTLSGHVETNELKKKATDATNDVEGVKSVINNLHVGAH